MPKHTEYLTGPVVSSRNAAMMNPGEVTDARNCHWLPGNPALTRARGRTAFGTVSATAVDVNGLRDIQFDNDNHYLITHASASYQSAAVGDTGTFGVLDSTLDGVGSQLEAVQYRNRFFLFNGVSTNASAQNSNRVVYLSATAAANTPISRYHGLLPVLSSPNVTTAAGTFSQTVTGYYEYWTTEVAKITQDGGELVIEGAYSSESNPTTVYITAVGQVPQIEQPPIRNTLATHWRVYRSTMKDTESDRRFPTGFLVGEAGTATAIIQDTFSGASASSFASAFNTSGPYSSFASASSMASDNGVYASATGFTAASPAQQGCYGFNFGGFKGTVRGIQVEVQGYVSNGAGPVPLAAQITRRGADGGQFGGFVPIGPLPFIGKSGLISSTNSASPTTLTLGGQTDRWVASDKPGFSDSDFDGNLMLVLQVTKSGHSVGIDYVKITVYYGTTVDSVVPYPSVVYTFGDVTTQVSKNGPPPPASTGDIYEDCLVTNDVTNRSLIRYSYPGEPESFPGVYYLDFETQENDRVRLIKTLNNHLIVALDSSIWRINYLPNERDAQFDRGKAKEAISRNFGVVNPMCACVYSVEGQGERLAFVSDHGIHDTNGYDFRTLTDDVAWRTYVLSSTVTSNAIALIDDRERRTLLLYYRNDLENNGYYALPLCYSVDHLVNGKPKVGGRIHMDNVSGAGLATPKSAWSVPRSSGAQDVYIGYGGSSTAAGAGKVYRETGYDSPAGESGMRYRTRMFYMNGLGSEWMLNDCYGYVGSYTGSPVVTYAVAGAKTNGTLTTFGGGKTVTAVGPVHRLPFKQIVEGMQFIVQVGSASAYEQESITLDWEPRGREDSGK